jgi:hypothetical protein
LLSAGLIHTEPLEADELTFLQKKEEKERAQYYKVFSILMVASFLFSFAGSWYRAYEGAPNAFSVVKFFVCVIILLGLSAGAVYFTYRKELHKLQMDIKRNTKTIEITHIKKKKYMPQNKSYHFYLESVNKLSIEVSRSDFYMLNEGDEVTIQYTTWSKYYLGHY